jgi:hypothetical protein
MKEGQKHIRKKNDPNVSYCGANIYLEFALLDLEHAEGCIETESRIQPCPKCLKLAKKDK